LYKELEHFLRELVEDLTFVVEGTVDVEVVFGRVVGGRVVGAWRVVGARVIGRVGVVRGIVAR
jgi:hypothetical protein